MTSSMPFGVDPGADSPAAPRHRPDRFLDLRAALASPPEELDFVIPGLLAGTTLSDEEIAATEEASQQMPADTGASADTGREVRRANQKVAQRAATSGISPQTLDSEGKAMDREAQEVAVRCIRQLAASDSDYARELNDVGFSKADVHLGHALANVADCCLEDAHFAMMRRLIMRYRRQLPASTVDIVVGYPVAPK